MADSNPFRGFFRSMDDDQLAETRPKSDSALSWVITVLSWAVPVFVVAGLYGTLFGWGAWWRE